MTIQGTIHPDSTLEHGRMRERVENTVSNVKSKLGRAVDMGKTRVSEWKGGVESGIRHKPLQSVLIAVAVGAVLGVLLGRRTR